MKIFAKIEVNFFKTFNDGQLERLSEIIGNLGIVFFASTVAPVFVGQQIKLDWINVFLGVITSLIFWSSSLYFSKEVNNE